MLLETVIKLASHEGNELVKTANLLFEARYEPVRALATLRKTGKNTDLAAAAWEVARFRSRAVGKLGPIASSLIFDRDGYEMASSVGCSAYHADILCGWGAKHVVDLCGGIGVDALAFAARGLQVTVYEIDPGRAEMVRCNAAAAGLSGLIDVRCEDVTNARFPESATAAYFDPARRTETRRRSIAPEDMSPPLSLVNQLRDRGMGHILVKLAPSSDRGLGAHYDGSLEFLSDDGECKEALLRIGDGGMSNGVSAVILPDRIVISATAATTTPIEARIGSYVYEPDPAVIRAGHVGEVATAADGWLLDADVAYVMSDARCELAYAVRYAIVESFPFHVKKLQQALDRLGAGRVIVKKRAVAIEPIELAKKLKLTGEKEYVVIISRSGKTQWCMIALRDSGLVELHGE